jgi:hypothetical protein
VSQSDFYKVADTKVEKRIISNVFSSRDKDVHSKQRNLILGSYKFSSIIQSEHLADETLDVFFKCIDEKFIDTSKSGTVCELDNWFDFFAWDVVGQFTMRKPMNFIEAGTDHSGMIKNAGKAMDYFAVVGQIPLLDKLLAKNPLYKIGPASWEAATGSCFKKSMARQQDAKQGKLSESKDMLDNFLELKKTAGFDDYGVIGFLMVSIVAGADTIDILSRAIVYHTLKNPYVLRKLQNELDNANLPTPVTFAAANTLPYLGAVISEPLASILASERSSKVSCRKLDCNFLMAHLSLQEQKLV